ncbi:MAG: hypothetical protein J6V54_09955 [Bacteroidales bacterium]|nr:hypothetical protein [Bacteroidales bacterium]
MTKYFKFLGVALIAMSMALVSCEEPNGTNGGDGTEQGDPTPDPEPEPDPDPDPEPDPDPQTSVNVTFGSDTWTATQQAGGYFTEDGLFGMIAIAGQGIPRVDAYVFATATGNISDEIGSNLRYINNNIYRLEYTLQGAITLTYTDGSEIDHGDWWAKTATINVTALDPTALTLSANISAVMFEFLGIVTEDGQIDPSLLPNASTQNMTCAISNLQMEAMKGASLPEIDLNVKVK